MFTDESRFVLEPDDKRIRIWREQRTRNQSQNITEHHAFRGGSTMVWAGISLGYRTDLHIFKRGSLTAVRYRDEVLEHIVRLYSAAVGLTFVLMDHNARPHRADIVDDYLESEGIARMAWPAYSPDLNGIQNLWDALGRSVSLRFPPRATLIEVETALQEEWRLLNSAVVDHLIESMVTRAMGPQFLFMDDNAPPHRTVTVEELLESEDIEHMDWSARSLDLNPVKHVRNLLGRPVAARNLSPVTIPKLRLVLQEERAAVSQQLINNHISSMHK
ncbi:Transposable element Tc3 transposase, partial [Stegodyphus mimosarum]